MSEDNYDYGDNYYLRRYDCTRNQYRRIVNNVAYQEHLDGSKEIYGIRRLRILGLNDDQIISGLSEEEWIPN